MTSKRVEPLFPEIWKRRFIVVFLLVAAITLLFLLQGILMPFLFAWIAAYLVSPLVDLMEKRWKFSRAGSVLLVMTLFILLITTFFAITIPIVVDETMGLISSLPAYRDRIIATFYQWQDEGRIHPFVLGLANQALENLQASMPELAKKAAAWALSGLSSLLGIIGFVLNLILFFFVFFYFLRDFREINQTMIKAVPAANRKAMSELLKEIDLSLRAVLRGQFLVALSMAVLYSIGLSIVGIPYAILIGTIAGFGNFLPYVGPMLGMIPAFLAVFLHGDGVGGPILGILIVFGIVQFLEGFFLTPRIAGSSMGLGPVAVIFAVSAGGALLGFVGIVAALPLAAIIKVLLEHGWDKYTESDFYAG